MADLQARGDRIVYLDDNGDSVYNLPENPLTLDGVLIEGDSSNRDMTVGNITATDITANRIITSNRVAFAASQDNTGGDDTPAGYVDDFETVHFNVGNHFDPVTGVFTAPFDGLYHFSYQNIHSNGSGNRADISLELNPVNFSADPQTAPTQIEGGNPRTIIRVRGDIDEANWNTVTFSVPVILSQNDFVVLYYHVGTTSDNTNYGGAAYWNQFSGYYVG